MERLATLPTFSWSPFLMTDSASPSGKPHFSLGTFNTSSWLLHVEKCSSKSAWTLRWAWLLFGVAQLLSTRVRVCGSRGVSGQDFKQFCSPAHVFSGRALDGTVPASPGCTVSPSLCLGLGLWFFQSTDPDLRPPPFLTHPLGVVTALSGYKISIWFFVAPYL